MEDKSRTLVQEINFREHQMAGLLCSIRQNSSLVPFLLCVDGNPDNGASTLAFGGSCESRKAG